VIVDATSYVSGRGQHEVIFCGEHCVEGAGSYMLCEFSAPSARAKASPLRSHTDCIARSAMPPSAASLRADVREGSA